MKNYGMAFLLCAALAAGMFTGCSGATNSASSTSASSEVTASTQVESAGMPSGAAPSGMPSGEMPSGAAPSGMPSGEMPAGDPAATGTATSSATEAAGSALVSASDLFTDRDLEQEADTSSAQKIAVTSGEDVTISEEGVYVISGDAEDVTITVEADSEAKVQLVLDGVTITNTDAPAIYVTSADKVFITTASGSTNKLTVTGEFAAIGDATNIDGVIFAKDDIVLNGQGTLVINSSANGIVGKDDVKVTGGTYEITAANHGIQGKDSVAITDGTFDITATTDGIHAENSDDQSQGYVYIGGGTFNIDVQSDGIEGDAFVQIDGGTINISGEEGIEGTYIQINDGAVSIDAWDDGINASLKSTEYDCVLEINGGNVTVVMAAGDTDALDSNGSLFITGGNVDITAQFPFDYMGATGITGGTVTVNGQQVTEIYDSMMAGGMQGGQQGGLQGGPQGGGMRGM